MLVSYPLAFLVIRTIKESNYEQEHVVFVTDKEPSGKDQESEHDEKAEVESPTLPSA